MIDDITYITMSLIYDDIRIFDIVCSHFHELWSVARRQNAFKRQFDFKLISLISLIYISIATCNKTQIHLKCNSSTSEPYDNCYIVLRNWFILDLQVGSKRIEWDQDRTHLCIYRKPITKHMVSFLSQPDNLYRFMDE